MKIKQIFLAALALVFLCVPAYATPFLLNDWNFDPDGSSSNSLGLVEDIDSMIVSGVVLKNTTLYNANETGAGTFELYGSYNVESFKHGTQTIAGTGINNDYQLTFVVQATGEYYTVNDINYFDFTTATLDFYLDPNTDYGTASNDGIYGGDNGVNIGSF